MELENKIEFEVSPPYPEDKGNTWWGCVLRIKDRNNKVNFMEDELFFEVSYPTMKGGGEKGYVHSYADYSQSKNPNSFIYRIEKDIPIKMILSTKRKIDLSGLYFELFKWSKFYGD